MNSAQEQQLGDAGLILEVILSTCDVTEREIELRDRLSKDPLLVSFGTTLPCE